MRAILTILLAVCISLSFCSCGLISHQARNVKQLWTAPFRVELEDRFLDSLRDLERESLVPLHA